MTPIAALAFVWTHRAPVAIGAGALAVVALWAAWRHDHAALAAARAQAEQRAEAAELEKKHVVAAAQVDKAEAEKRLLALVAESEGFRQELARVKAAAPGAKVEVVARLGTGELTAGGAPREPGPTSSSPTRPSGEGEKEDRPEGGASGMTPAAGPPCLLAEGDRGHIVARVAGLRARAGTLAVAGEAECWRDAPGPPSRVLAGTFEAEASSVAEVREPAPVERARLALRAGPDWSEWRAAPSGAVVGGGVRVLGAWWLEGEGRISAAPAASVQLRREF